MLYYFIYLYFSKCFLSLDYCPIAAKLKQWFLKTNDFSNDFDVQNDDSGYDDDSVNNSGLKCRLEELALELEENKK